jgi:hypothetical protein
MALITKQALGFISGILGPVVCKVRQGRNYISRKPINSKLPMDNGSVFRREQFRFIGKLSKAIYASQLLRKEWEKNKTENTWCTYDDIFKHNYTSAKYNDPGYIPQLLPGRGFSLNNPQITKIRNGYEIKAGLSSAVGQFNPDLEKFVSVTGILSVDNLPGRQDTPLTFFPITGEKIILDLSSPLILKIILVGERYTAFTGINNQKAFFTIVTLDDSGCPVQFSEVIKY